ncbi:MAG: hypothetical protein ACRC41_00370 [Sarcina sp.]
MDVKKQRYLESYKRLYFKGEIQNPKTKNILEKKRISLGLSVEETEIFNNELENSFDLVVSYIKDFLDINYDGTEESLVLDEFDRKEIEEFWKDMNLSDEDGGRCLELAINSYKVSNEEANIKNSNTDEYVNSKSTVKATVETLTQTKVKEIDEAYNKLVPASINSIDGNEFGVDFMSGDLILNQYKSIVSVARERKDEMIQMKFLNFVLSYAISYEGEVFKEKNRENFNAETLKDIFKSYYQDFLEEYLLILQEVGVTDEEIASYTFDEFFDLSKIDSYVTYIDSVRKFLESKKEEEYTWILRNLVEFEEIRVNAYLGKKTCEYISNVLTECKENKVYEYSGSRSAHKVVDATIIHLIANLTKGIMFKIKKFIDFKFETVNLDELIESKELAIVSLNSAKASKSIDYDRYLTNVIDALREYPYIEEAHLELLESMNVEYEQERLFLDIAHNIISLSGESCANINKKLIDLNSDLYMNSIAKFKDKNLKFIEMRGMCENLRGKFKIKDPNVIVRCELKSFGKVLSNINYSEIDSDLRTILYKKDMNGLKERNDIPIEEKALSAKSLRTIYKIEDEQAVIDTEIEVFGMVYSDVNFEKVPVPLRRDIFIKRLNELEAELDSYKIDQDILEDKIIEYKELYKIDTKYAMNLEISRFGRWFGDLDVSDFDEEDLEEFILRQSERIMMLTLSEDKKTSLLNQLKEKSKYSNRKFYELQEQIGNNKISLNDEDSVDMEFIKKASEIYNKFNKIILEEKIIASTEADFRPGVFIKKYSNLRETLRDESLFLLRKANNREGFLITSKAIYHSEWDNAVLLKDIKKILWKERSLLKNGQRQFRPYIHIVTDSQELVFEYVGFRQIDVFTKFLIEFVNTYKTLLGQPLSVYERVSIEDGSLSIKEMLHGNTYLDKYEGDINKLDDPKAVYDFIKSNISSELKKFVKLQDINSKFDAKVKNAIAAYAPIEQNEIPLIAYDSTLFKSGKEGFILTTKGIYCKNKFGTPWKMTHKKIRLIKLEEEILIFTDKQTTITSVTDKERFEFRDLLEFCSYVFKNK